MLILLFYRYSKRKVLFACINCSLSLRPASDERERDGKEAGIGEEYMHSLLVLII